MKINWGIDKFTSTRHVTRRSTLPTPPTFETSPEYCESHKAASLLGTFNSLTHTPSHKANAVLGTFASAPKNNDSYKANVVLGVVSPCRNKVSRANALKKNHTAPSKSVSKDSELLTPEVSTRDGKKKGTALNSFVMHLEALSTSENPPANVPKDTILQMIDALGKTKDGVIAA